MMFDYSKFIIHKSGVAGNCNAFVILFYNSKLNKKLLIFLSTCAIIIKNCKKSLRAIK